MTNADYTHYVLIIDRSGSMFSIQKEAQGGVRQFVKDQQTLPGKATITLCEFDNEYNTVYDFAPLASVFEYFLSPRGMTGLLDAVGFTVTTVGEKLAALPEDERPGKVVVLIVTDGEENASSEFTQEQVKALVEQQTNDYGWAFSYIGANVDAFKAAGGIGIAAGSTLAFAATAAGTANTFASMSANTMSYRKGMTRGVTYSDSDREAAQED